VHVRRPLLSGSFFGPQGSRRSWRDHVAAAFRLPFVSLQ